MNNNKDIYIIHSIYVKSLRRIYAKPILKQLSLYDTMKTKTSIRQKHDRFIVSHFYCKTF